MPLSVASTDREKILISANPDGPIQGALRISVVEGGATFNQTSDTSFEVISQDLNADIPEAVTVFHVEADADLGEGEVLISDDVTYTVTNAMAESLGLSAGTPQPK